MRAKIDICVILQQLFIFKRIHCWFVINMRWPITYCMSLYESIWHFVWIHYMISGILYLFTIMSHYIVVAVINISGDKKHILLTIAWMLLIHTLNNFLWHIDALLLPFDVIFYAFYTLKAPIERKDKTKVCTYETFLAMTLSTGILK